MEERPTLDSLRRKAGLKASKLLRRADLSTATWSRINHRQPVSYESVMSLLRVLNEELGTQYTPQNIDVKISD